MKSLRHPGWILVFNTFPLAILLLVFFLDLYPFRATVSPETITSWMLFAGSLMILWLASFGYALFLISKKQVAPSWYAWCSIAGFVLWFYIFSQCGAIIFPMGISPWVLRGLSFNLPWTVVILVVVHGLLIVVANDLSKENVHRVWVSWVVVAGMLIAGFISYFVNEYIYLGDFFFNHLSTFVFIAFMLGFVYFVVKGSYGLFVSKERIWVKYALLWKALIALVLPVAGLLLNNLWIGEGISGIGSYVFGDFSSTWFYVLTGLNALALGMPRLNHIPYRLILFVIRSVTFAFTLYFSIVFLPYLPLSIILIFIFGAGLLMLIPFMLFALHSNALAQDYRFLRESYSATMLWIVGVVALLLIPAVITVGFYQDKKMITSALSYLYTPDYSSEMVPSSHGLQRVVKNGRYHRSSSNVFFAESSIPYISAWYRRVVFRNMTLSDRRLIELERVFLDKRITNERHSPPLFTNHVSITDITVESRYDADQELWISRLDLEITNANEASGAVGYSTVFTLPHGCWISDYNLYVEETKEPGMLVEKRSAIWIFNLITRRREDPGLLHYLTGNRIAFRVFPFTGGEVRKTGIEFAHIEPVNLLIDSHKISLGTNWLDDHEGHTPVSGLPDGMAWVSGSVKQGLPKVYRKPTFHFLVDVSVSGRQQLSRAMSLTEKMMRDHPELSKRAKISLVNSAVYPLSAADEWRVALEEIPDQGGFFLDRAIRKTLIDAWKRQDETYPVIVVVSDSPDKGVVFDDFSDLRFTSPDNDLLYHLSLTGVLSSHLLWKNPHTIVYDTVGFATERPVLAWHDKKLNSICYVADDDAPSLVPTGKEIATGAPPGDDAPLLTKALYQQAQWYALLLHPETTDEAWLPMVQQSFRSGIMSPFTAYIVVETEAQKTSLLQKQKAVLKGSPMKDLSEQTQSMSEPGWIMLLLLILLVWMKNRGSFR
jgi:hypothetical protein